MEQLEKSVEPSWPKLVEPLEKLVDRLTVVWGVINHLTAVKDTPELRAALIEMYNICGQRFCLQMHFQRLKTLDWTTSRYIYIII